VDIPDKKSLISCKYSCAEVCQQIGADSLGFLSLEHLHEIAPDAKCGFCEGCFSGKYPVEPPADYAELHGAAGN
jgi:amidophosphoribosyltransferase